MSDIEGLDALERRLNAMLHNAPAAADRALSDVSHDLAGRSSALAPIEFGDLRGSVAVRRNGEGQYEVGFYGLPYALMQHERLDYLHPRGGQAKYLEQPFAENTRKYVQDIADAIKGAL